jgi:Tat protein translocase TatB subunit
MLNIGPQELLLILVIALIVVGPQRLPTLGRSIGRGLREIRKAQDEVKRTIQVNLDEEPADNPERRPTARRGSERGSLGSAAGGGGPAAGDVLEGTQAVPPAVAPDPIPLASEPPTPSEVTEISRTLGRSLGELRRAREEMQELGDLKAGARVSSGSP